MPTQRNTAMDVVRGFCILLVFLFHGMPALEIFAGLEATPAVAVFNFFFQPYRMTLLMFLSGMLLHLSLKKPPRIFVEGKLASIYGPFLLWSVLILLAEERLDFITLVKMPISAPTVLWYLWFLFAYYLLALGIHRAKISFPMIIVASFLASLVLPDFLRMSRFAYLFGFFLLGHVLASRLELIPRTRLFPAVMLLVVVIGGVISASGHKINYDTRYVFFPIALVLLTLWAMPHYRSTRWTQFVEWVGRNSMVFYVLHFLVQVLFVRVIVELSGPFGTESYGWLYAGTVLLPILVGGIFTWARSRSFYVALLFDFRQWREIARGKRRGSAAE